MTNISHDEANPLMLLIPLDIFGCATALIAYLA